MDTATRPPCVLALALAAGYVPTDPRTLALAIRRLRVSARLPWHPYRDRRADPFGPDLRAEAARAADELEGRAGLIHQPNEKTPMNINAAFPGSYIKAADLQGRTVRVSIADCALAKFDDGDKPVLHFTGKDRGLVMNKTNAGILADAFGPETDHWRGRAIELYPDRVMYSGRMVDAIRVRVPAQPAPAAPTPAAPPPADLDPEGWADEIPF